MNSVDPPAISTLSPRNSRAMLAKNSICAGNQSRCEPCSVIAVTVTSRALLSPLSCLPGTASLEIAAPPFTRVRACR